MTVYIIGAGMAGLSAAFTLAEKGVPVIVYDASIHAGGRCYSYYDKHLDATIDNGTHLMLGANTALLKMLKQCPTTTSSLDPIDHDILISKKDRTTVHFDLKHPFSTMKHIPDIYPLACESIMNTSVKEADKVMLLKTAFLCCTSKDKNIYLASSSLHDAIVQPILDYLEQKAVPVYYGKRLYHLEDDRLIFKKSDFLLNKEDRIILAIPEAAALQLLPKKTGIIPHQTIVSIHYKSDLTLPENRKFIGLKGYTAHWIFVKNGILSVTISAANELIKKYEADEIAELVWREVQDVLHTDAPLPLHRTIINRRATLSQSRENNKQRPNQNIGLKKVFVAGDDTDTGLPCTIEGAVRSGISAAKLTLNSL